MTLNPGAEIVSAPGPPQKQGGEICLEKRREKR